MGEYNSFITYALIPLVSLGSAFQELGCLDFRNEGRGCLV